MDRIMTDRPFVHLHCHSHYSLLDGAGAIKKLVGRAKEHGMNALALTDHGNLHGALQFYTACKAEEINPIIGYEAYIAPGSRFEKSGGSMKDASYHLTLLAQNKVGFKNLVKLASAASLEGFYFKPRIDKEILAQHSEGIICLSGCVSSEFNRAILKGHGAEPDLTEARQIAEWFHTTFGDRYFVEIMNNGVEIQRIALEGAVDLANKVGLPLVATSDAHYVDREDAEAQDILLCINTGKFRTDANRMKMDGAEYYLRNQEEMYDHFPGLEHAVARSQEIADSVDIDLELGKRYFPTYKIPEQKTADEYLRELCIKGLKERYAGDPERIGPDGELTQVVMDRLNRELGVISKLGFPNYFLIVWDFTRVAREMGIPATARGSGVGAIVCFALYLSHACPLKYDLLFERFLDESRLEAPDIDIDFCKERRADVIKYVKETYGEENVAQIGTFGTLQARAAIKDVGRALGIPIARVAQITDMVPDVLNIKLKDAIEQSEDLRNVYQADPEVRELLDLALRIEGLARNVGTHAAAVVIADQPLTEYVPLGRVPGKQDIITQWSMNDVEDAGLLKMDFLGLRNLTILRTAVDIIEETTGQRIDPLSFPLDDKETFALLQRGETKGVFQLESGGIRDLLKKMKPDQFSDIIATNALYRPGPLEGGMVDEYVNVKHGRKEAEYKHDVLKEILEETNGVMVYQEQVMRILNRLGKIPLAKAYTCIKAISKKKEALIQENHAKFIEGAVESGLKKADADAIWGMIIKFAGYGFNKSHSTAYALIAYQTAYLKAHWPIEFMAALLTGDIPNRNFKRKDNLVEHLEDCERMGITVEPPDVNRSSEGFTAREGKIQFGLSAIKGCAGAAPGAIEAAREADGPFKDLFDFCERVDGQSCNRSSIETLIKAGAFDSLGAKRSQLLAVIDRALQAGSKAAADKRSGQKSLFGDVEEQAEETAVVLPEMPEIEEREKLAMEKEVLGFYLTSHPLAEYESTLRSYCTHLATDLPSVKTKAEVLLGGMVSAVTHRHIRNPKPGAVHTKYVMFDLEDMDGAVRCILWPEEFAKYGEVIQADAVVIIRGSVDRRGGDEANIIGNEVTPIGEMQGRCTKGAVICLDEDDHNAESLSRVREIVRGYPGEQELELLLRLTDGNRVKIRAGNLRIEINDELRERLDEYLGPGRVQLKTEAPKVNPNAEGGNGRRFQRSGA